MPLALLALALGGFGIGLTEFVIVGLLPEVAMDFGVSEAAAGHLISGYALAVAVGAILLTAALARVERKRALLALMVLFIIGNLMSALAPSYQVMLGGRIVAALCHGAFFGIGAVLAADLVDAGRRARAIATMFAGLTLANVLGVPFGTWLGQQFGWRSTFWVITVIGVITCLGILVLVPQTARATDAGLRGEFAAFRNAQVWLSIVVTVLGFGGMFGAFTYIAFTLTETSGFSSTTVPSLLVLFGVGLLIGNTLGARAADRALTQTLFVNLGVLTAVLIVFALTAQNWILAVISLFLMGVFGFASVPGFQMRIMGHAATAPTLASGANIAAFNLGNALAAWLGGTAIAAGLGYTSPIWVGAAMTAAGLIVLAVAVTAAAADRPSHDTREGCESTGGAQPPG